MNSKDLTREHLENAKQANRATAAVNAQVPASNGDDMSFLASRAMVR